MLGRLFWAAVGLLLCVALWVGPVDALTRAESATPGRTITTAPVVPPAAAVSSAPNASVNTPANPVSSPASIAAAASAVTVPPVRPLGDAAVPKADVQNIVVVVPPHEVPVTQPVPPTTVGPGGTGATGATNAGIGSINSIGAAVAPLGPLPRTGLDGLTLRLILVALALLDLGWLFRSLAHEQGRRAARR